MDDEGMLDNDLRDLDGMIDALRCVVQDTIREGVARGHTDPYEAP